MRLFKSSPLSVYVDPDTKVTHASNKSGSIYRISDHGQLVLVECSHMVLQGILPLPEGDVYVTYPSGNESYKNIVFSDGYHQESGYEPVEARARFFQSSEFKLAPSVFKGTRNEVKIAQYNDWEKGITSALVLEGDYKDIGVLKALDSGVLEVYGRSGNIRFTFFDTQFKKQWGLTAEGKRPNCFDAASYFCDCGGSIVFSALMKQDGQQTHDGELWCVATTSGEALWKRRFPYQVDSVQVENDQHLLVLSSDKLYRLDATSGDILTTMETGLPNRVASHSMFLADEYCFLFSKHSKVMHIVDLRQFSIVRTWDFNDQKHVFWESVVKPTKIGRKLYFSLLANYYRKHLAEVDLDTLDVDPEFEKEPKLHIERPSEGYGPITIAADGEYIGDLLRYIHFTALELAEQDGIVWGSTGQNEHFNGVISVICTNTDADGLDVDECFENLKAAVEREAEKWKMRCGTGKNPITLEYSVQ